MTFRNYKGDSTIEPLRFLNRIKQPPQGAFAAQTQDLQAQEQGMIRRVLELKGAKALGLSEMDARRLYFGTDKDGNILTPEAAGVTWDQFNKALTGDGSLDPKREKSFLNPDGSTTYVYNNPDGSEVYRFTYSEVSDGSRRHPVVTFGDMGENSKRRSFVKNMISAKPQEK